MLGIFARQSRAYGNHDISAAMPRIWRYIEEDLAVPELTSIRDFLAQVLPPEAAWPWRHRHDRGRLSLPGDVLAGRSQHMRPLTDACPLPLLPVAGRTILDHSLDKLAAFGIAAVVVNCSYLGAQIVDHLAGRTVPPVILSPKTAR